MSVRKSHDGKLVTLYSAMTALESSAIEDTDINSFKNEDLGLRQPNVAMGSLKDTTLNLGHIKHSVTYSFYRSIVEMYRTRDVNQGRFNRTNRTTKVRVHMDAIVRK